MTEISKVLLQFEKNTTPLEARLRICKSSASTNSSVLNTCQTSSLNVESSVLSRVKAFLPVLSAANTKLRSEIEEKGVNEFDIEVLTKGESMPHVEMDLALGIADLKTPLAVAAAELAVTGNVNLREAGLQSVSSSDSEGEGREDVEESAAEDLQPRRSIGVESSTFCTKIEATKRVAPKSKRPRLMSQVDL